MKEGETLEIPDFDDIYATDVWTYNILIFRRKQIPKNKVIFLMYDLS